MIESGACSTSSILSGESEVGPLAFTTRVRLGASVYTSPQGSKNTLTDDWWELRMRILKSIWLTVNPSKTARPIVPPIPPAANRQAGQSIGHKTPSRRLESRKCNGDFAPTILGERQGFRELYNFVVFGPMSSRTVLRSLVCSILLLGTMPSLGQASFSPDGTLEKDSSQADWYSKQLKALHEPSLWELSKAKKTQTYRFLWLRTFHHPIAIRLDVEADGNSLLTTKISSGQGGYEPGRLIRNSTRKLSKEQTEWFLARIEELQFWSLPTKEAEEPNVINLDGAEWILEATKNGDYHLVERWSPDKGAVHALGIIMLIDLAKLKLLYQEVY